MNTERLITLLSADVASVPRHAFAQCIASGIAGGALITTMIVVGILGVRPDLPEAMHGFTFWMKLTYTTSLGVGAVYAVMGFARPATDSLRALWLLAIPALLLAGMGIGELASTPTRHWLAMWLGKSWRVCSLLVMMLAVPIFTGLLGSIRRLAPTRLRAAGAAAGLAAGAWGATLYCLHCPEVSAIFVLTWYSLGMLLMAVAGLFLGPRLMRW